MICVFREQRRYLNRIDERIGREKKQHCRFFQVWRAWDDWARLTEAEHKQLQERLKRHYHWFGDKLLEISARQESLIKDRADLEWLRSVRQG